MNHFTWRLLPAFGFLLLVIALVARLIPQSPVATATPHLPAWDLPARMLTATVFVMLLTTFADVLGPQLSGMLSPFPVFGLVLAGFAHQQLGVALAARLLRNMVLGSLAYAAFFLVVGALLVRLGMGWTYALATAAALSVNGLFLWWGRVEQGSTLHVR